MNDFFDNIERELVAAAERRAQLPWYRRLARRSGARTSRRTGALVLVGAALLVVPAGAAVTGVWDPTPAEPGPDAGIVAEPGEPLVEPGAGGADQEGDVVIAPESCTVPDRDPPPLSSRRPSDTTLGALGVLRAPRGEGDSLPPGYRERASVSGINADYVRLARESSTGGRFYVIPAEDINYTPPVPDTPECARFREQAPAPESGVCLQVVGDGGGGTCQTVENVENGLAMLTSDRVPGQREGTVNVTGIVPDGVNKVTLKYPAGAPVREVTAAVVGNIFTASFNGSAAVTPQVFWHTENGVREVGPEAKGR